LCNCPFKQALLHAGYYLVIIQEFLNFLDNFDNNDPFCFLIRIYKYSD
jgi:hypothetical protein